MGRLVRALEGAEFFEAFIKGYKNGDSYRTKYSKAAGVRELFSKLDPKKNIVIPHIHRMDWQNHNPIYEQLVEIYSCWGNREYSGGRYSNVTNTRIEDTVQYALSLGYKLGFVGGGDGHGGRPGKDYWLRVRGAMSGGITGIYAEELTREALWNALKSRRCYATTGKRIIIKFYLNEHMMGEIVNLSNKKEKRELKAQIYGTASISRITLVKNNFNICKKSPYQEYAEFVWEDKKEAADGDYYYIRVEQADGSMAWSSPIWINMKV